VTDEFRDHVGDLLVADALATTGAPHEHTIRRYANMAQSYVETDDVYFAKVAEDVQQCFHDEFVDTAWPECPKHRGRPMWVSDGWWVCDEDRVRIARIGELGSLLRAG